MTPTEELDVRWNLKLAELQAWADAMRWVASNFYDGVTIEKLRELVAHKFAEKQDEALMCITPEAMVANELMED
jgi:hypothetical protein